MPTSADYAHLVGEEIGVGEWVEITQDRIDGFAAATDDHQWIHVDRSAAERGPFGTTIAHGFLTLSLLPAHGVMPEVSGVAMGINYGLDRVRFISPVPTGSRVRARTTLLDVEDVTGGIQMKAEVTVDIEGSDRPACVAQTITRYILED